MMLKAKIESFLAVRFPFNAGRECPICERKIGRFLPYRGGWSRAPLLMRTLEIVGSDLDHYLCPACGSNDRERHLLLYLRAAGLLGQMTEKNILHFAPEPHLSLEIARANPQRHVLADLFPMRPEVQRVDMLAIEFSDATFDFVIANHVLEHVDDDTRALSEISRVLKPGGWAVLQTPFSNLLERTISDPGVRSAEARLHLYGQEDHVRLYGRDIFSQFTTSGLVSRVMRHETALHEFDSTRFGVNPAEPFFLFQKSSGASPR